MAAETKYEVVVSNLGTVYTGTDRAKAKDWFKNYAHISANCPECERAYGEWVTLIEDGEPVQEHEGKQYQWGTA